MQYTAGLYLTAKCGDLMLAKECVADLKSGDFGGLVRIQASDQHQRHYAEPQAFGDRAGEAASRGAIVGGLVGFVLGLAVSSVPYLGLDSLAGAVFGLCSGSVMGGFLRWKASRISATFNKPDGQERYTIRCDGSPEDLAIAKNTLQTAPCHDLQVHGQPVCESEREAAVLHTA